MPDTITAPTNGWTYGKDSKEGGRATQEDRCAIAEFITADGQTALLAMVADGIGGRTTGELASQWAAETIPQRVQGNPPATSEIPQALIAAFQAAHERIYDEAAENPSRAGMGTTCTVVVIVGRRLYLAHVGDSRAYVARGDRLHQLSIDHTWAEDALAAGRSQEEIRTHPNRGVIKRYLGINEEIDVDTRYRPFKTNAGTEPVDSAEKPCVLEDGDRLLLCTDGVSDVLAEGQILVALRSQPAAGDQAASAIVRAALKAHAQDNVTAVVVDLPGGAPTRRWPTFAGVGHRWAGRVAAPTRRRHCRRCGYAPAPTDATARDGCAHGCLGFSNHSHQPNHNANESGGASDDDHSPHSAGGCSDCYAADGDRRRDGNADCHLHQCAHRCATADTSPTGLACAENTKPACPNQQGQCADLAGAAQQ